MSDKTLIITGGCGFLGTHLADRFSREGYSIIAVDNFCTSSRKNADFLKSLGRHIQVIEGDVCNAELWKTNPLLKQAKPRFILHFASPASPPLYQEMALETLWVNSLALNHALDYADSKGARVVFASTSEIYGDPDISPQPESYWGNVNTVGVRSCYDEAKRFGESLIFTRNLKKKSGHGMVRIFNTYGPRMNPSDGRVVINFLVQALKGQALTIYGDGKQTRSFCYVSDLVEGIFRYTHSTETTPMNIGNSREFTILDLANTVKKMFPGKSLPIVFQEAAKDDPKQRCPNLERAKTILKWGPEVTLEKGLTLMLEWLREDLSHT